MNRLLLTLLLLSSTIFASPNIVVSIKPIHSIVSSITQGVSQPKLLLKDNQSAHHFYLKPSQLLMIEKADLVIAIHPQMEQGLNKILKNIDTDKKLYAYQSKQIHDEEHDHDTENYHIWLDINQMQQFSVRLAKKLIAIDPVNKHSYENNLKNLNTALNQLQRNTLQQLSTYKHRDVAGYSNALAHFVSSNRLNQSLSVTTRHEERLSVYKAIKAKNTIKNKQIKCLLSTSDVPNSRINTLTEGLSINAAKIDIIGFDINPGPQHYSKLINRITDKVGQCLQ